MKKLRAERPHKFSLAIAVIGCALLEVLQMNVLYTGSVQVYVCRMLDAPDRPAG